VPPEAQLAELVSVNPATLDPLLRESYTAALFVSLDNDRWAAANAPRLLRPERLRYSRGVGASRGLLALGRRYLSGS
jgi:hypothetical protein